jgi:cell division transport system permease protein
MRAWLNTHTQALTRALLRMRAQPLATALSIAVIAIAILLPLALYIVFANVTNAASRLNTAPNVNVYLALTATDAEAKDTEKKIRAQGNAASVAFIPRETALAEMKKRANLGDLLAGIDSNPLPHAFAIKPTSTDAATLDAMRRDIAALPKVETVTMDFEWAKKLARFVEFAQRIVFLISAVLAAAVVFVIGNTIRLQMLTQKDEIIVARLIGATRRFVRRPFLYFGALQGAAAGVIAVIAMIGLTYWVGNEVNALAVTYGADFQLRAPTLLQSALVIGAGVFLGWLGAFVSVSMYWRQIEKNE